MSSVGVRCAVCGQCGLSAPEIPENSLIIYGENKMLYCIYYKDKGLYKIGKTNNFERRFKQHCRRWRPLLAKPEIVGFIPKKSYFDEAGMLSFAENFGARDESWGREYFRIDSDKEAVFRFYWSSFDGISSQLSDAWKGYEVYVLGWFQKSNSSLLEDARKNQDLAGRLMYIFENGVFREKAAIINSAFKSIAVYHEHLRVAGTLAE